MKLTITSVLLVLIMCLYISLSVPALAQYCPSGSVCGDLPWDPTPAPTPCSSCHTWVPSGTAARMSPTQLIVRYRAHAEFERMQQVTNGRQPRD